MSIETPRRLLAAVLLLLHLAVGFAPLCALACAEAQSAAAEVTISDGGERSDCPLQAVCDYYAYSPALRTKAQQLIAPLLVVDNTAPPLARLISHHLLLQSRPPA